MNLNSNFDVIQYWPQNHWIQIWLIWYCGCWWQKMPGLVSKK